MSKFSINNIQRSAQSGFTLIELIVVMVILGILAATALPKFANLGGDARMAKLQAARAAMISGAAMYHSRWLANGSPSTASTTFDTNIVVNTTGYPDNASIILAAGGLADYDTTTAAGSVATDTNHPNCKIVYTASTGVVGAVPAITSCE